MTDGQLRQTFLRSFPALIVLDHDVDRIDAAEVLSVAMFLPIRGPRNANRRDAVMPKGVDVGFALDQDHMSGIPRLGESVQPIELRLRSCLPAEAITVQ